MVNLLVNRLAYQTVNIMQFYHHILVSVCCPRSTEYVVTCLRVASFGDRCCGRLQSVLSVTMTTIVVLVISIPQPKKYDYYY